MQVVQRVRMVQVVKGCHKRNYLFSIFPFVLQEFKQTDNCYCCILPTNVCVINFLTLHNHPDRLHSTQTHHHFTDHMVNAHSKVQSDAGGIHRTKGVISYLPLANECPGFTTQQKGEIYYRSSNIS